MDLDRGTPARIDRRLLAGLGQDDVPDGGQSRAAATPDLEFLSDSDAGGA
jgi:hypothetical protein